MLKFEVKYFDLYTVQLLQDTWYYWGIHQGTNP